MTNCGFEADGGGLSDWTTNGYSYGHSVVASGGHSASTGNGVGRDATISQVIATAAGTQYQIVFDTYQEGGTPNETLLSFGGVQIGALENAAEGWVEHTYSVTATSISTVLEISQGNNPGTAYLDNVIVTSAQASTPEPATWQIAVVTLALGAAWRRRQVLLPRN